MNKLESLKAAGGVSAAIFNDLTKLIKPGTNALAVETFISRSIEHAKMKPAFLGFKGYPAASCISINSAIVHGIPYHYIFQEGDVVSVDLGIKNNGWIIDTARTYGVGKISPEHKKLLEVTEKALDKAIEVCRVGNRVGDIGEAVQTTVESANFAIVKELTGHGVGKTLQEKPSIPNFGKRGTGPELTDGMVLAIEPITTVSATQAVVLADGWTIASRNDSVSAHFEDTIMVTSAGPIILTRPS